MKATTVEHSRSHAPLAAGAPRLGLPLVLAPALLVSLGLWDGLFWLAFHVL